MQRVQLALVKVAADQAAGLALGAAVQANGRRWMALWHSSASPRLALDETRRSSADQTPCRGPIFGTQITP